MSEELMTFAKMLRKVFFSLFLENMGLILWDAIPKFTFSFMKKVNSS